MILKRSVEGKTPYELFAEKSDHLNRFHIFGTFCYLIVPKKRRKKWDAKGSKAVFFGYSEDTDGFRVWMKDTRKVIQSPEVAFGPEHSSKVLALFPAKVSDKDSVKVVHPVVEEIEDHLELLDSPRVLYSPEAPIVPGVLNPVLPVNDQVVDAAPQIKEFDETPKIDHSTASS